MEAPKKILIVDDDPDLLETLEFELKKDQHQVVSASGREEAEDVLLKTKPDLAILDLMMEEQDSGFVLCRMIKKMYPGTPVIILTSVTAATGISFAARTTDERSWIGADLLVDKPARPEKLRADIQRLLHP
jgi:two-component system, OmpR family, response regulator